MSVKLFISYSVLLLLNIYIRAATDTSSQLSSAATAPVAETLIESMSSQGPLDDTFSEIMLEPRYGELSHSGIFGETQEIWTSRRKKREKFVSGWAAKSIIACEIIQKINNNYHKVEKRLSKARWKIQSVKDYSVIQNTIGLLGYKSFRGNVGRLEEITGPPEKYELIYNEKKEEIQIALGQRIKAFFLFPYLTGKAIALTNTKDDDFNDAIDTPDIQIDDLYSYLRNLKADSLVSIGNIHKRKCRLRFGLIIILDNLQDILVAFHGTQSSHDLGGQSWFKAFFAVSKDPLPLSRQLVRSLSLPDYIPHTQDQERMLDVSQSRALHPITLKSVRSIISPYGCGVGPLHDPGKISFQSILDYLKSFKVQQSQSESQAGGEHLEPTNPWKFKIVGHSLGGTIAQFLAIYLAKQISWQRINLIIFGTPKSIDRNISKLFLELLNVKIRQEYYNHITFICFGSQRGDGIIWQNHFQSFSQSTYFYEHPKVYGYMLSPPKRVIDIILRGKGTLKDAAFRVHSIKAYKCSLSRKVEKYSRFEL